MSFSITNPRLIISLWSILLCEVLVVKGAPQFYLHDAVKQAHSMNLLPQYAVVDKTAPGIQVGYYNIGPYERADLNSALGGSIPLDVLKSLENQVDAIGAMGSATSVSVHDQKQKLYQAPRKSYQIQHQPYSSHADQHLQLYDY